MTVVILTDVRAAWRLACSNAATEYMNDLTHSYRWHQLNVSCARITVAIIADAVAAAFVVGWLIGTRTGL